MRTAWARSRALVLKIRLTLDRAVAAAVRAVAPRRATFLFSVFVLGGLAKPFHRVDDVLIVESSRPS